MLSLKIIDLKIYFFCSPCPHSSNRPLVDNSDDNPERLIDNSDLHILDYAPTLKTLCILAVLEHNLDITVLPRDVV